VKGIINTYGGVVDSGGGGGGGGEAQGAWEQCLGQLQKVGC